MSYIGKIFVNKNIEDKRIDFFRNFRVFLLLSLNLFSCQNLFSEIEVIAVRSVEEIDQFLGKQILVKAFMTGYEDVPLLKLNKEFQSIGDVRRFYESYFESELEHFKHGGLIWIQAFEDKRLVGFSTFELEKNEKDAAYMNLLVVDPRYQGKGIGKQLTFSIRGVYPNVLAINLLIRKVNVSGRKFYEKIGFFDFEVVRDNFVDVSLLTGLRWEL